MYFRVFITTNKQKKIQTNKQTNRQTTEQIELQAKLLNYFLGSNKSNINQQSIVLMQIGGAGL